MNLRRMLADIAEGFRGGPGRIALALSALSVGMVALTLLLAVMAGLRQRAERLTSELGANVIAILPGGDANSTLRQDLAPLLAANLPGVSVSGIARSMFPSPDGRSQWLIVSADDALGRVREWNLRAGRLLDGYDIARAPQRSRHRIRGAPRRTRNRKFAADSGHELHHRRHRRRRG